MSWKDILQKTIITSEEWKRKEEERKQRNANPVTNNVPPPRPDMNAPSVPSAPDLEMEQIKAKLKEAQQSNNPRNIKIYTNKLNALMDKKGDASAPQIPKPQLGGGNRLPQMVGARPKRSINQKKLEEWKKVIQREKGPTGESAVTASPPRPPRKPRLYEEPTGSSGGI